MVVKFPFMTSKMSMLFSDIIASLGTCPLEQRALIFGSDDEVNMDWVIKVASHITLEYIKYSFDFNDPEYPIRHFLENSEDDSERMLQSRIMQYVLKYKKQEINTCGGKVPSKYSPENIDMDEIDKKLKGYRLTEMNFFEHQNIHNLELVKSIVERRIVSSKKISNERFKDLFEEYDEFVKKLIERSQKSDKDMVFASLVLFIFEWHYPIETFYNLACCMEENEIKTVDKDSLGLICGRVEIESCFGGWVKTDSRMVKERQMFLPFLLENDTNNFKRKAMNTIVKETLVLCTKYKEIVPSTTGELYKDWFRKESNTSDWASFFRFYNIFEIWQKKEWTREKIQNMRYLFDLVLIPQN